MSLSVTVRRYGSYVETTAKPYFSKAHAPRPSREDDHGDAVAFSLSETRRDIGSLTLGLFMSRSRRKTPIFGITTSESEKEYKRQENRRRRRKDNTTLGKAEEDGYTTDKDFGNRWGGPRTAEGTTKKLNQRTCGNDQEGGVGSLSVCGH